MRQDKCATLATLNRGVGRRCANCLGRREKKKISDAFEAEPGISERIPSCVLKPRSLPVTVKDWTCAGTSLMSFFVWPGERETHTVSWSNASCCIIIQHRWRDVLLTGIFKVSRCQCLSPLSFPASPSPRRPFGRNVASIRGSHFDILLLIRSVLLFLFCQLRHCDRMRDSTQHVARVCVSRWSGYVVCPFSSVLEQSLPFPERCFQLRAQPPV